MIPGTELKNRIKKIRELANTDAVLISKPKNLLYITGIESCRLLLTQDSCVMFTSEPDYKKINLPGIFDVELYEKNKIKNYINKLKPGKLGIENIDIKSYEKLRENIKPGIIVSVSDAVEKARMIKSGYEIEMLKKSAAIAKKGMEKAYEVITPGIFEIAAAAEIEYEIRKNGSETPPFECGMLLASGENASKIHGFPAQKKIKEGELVVVDLGARYGNYYSDMTRTIPAGKLKQNSEQAKVYEFIKNLQQELIDWIEIGMESSDVHKFAEEKIKKFGYKFYHGIGHGIGLNIHEMPHFRDAKTKLCKHNVFTIEPGIYTNKFGVRFEDMVLLTGKGSKILT